MHTQKMSVETRPKFFQENCYYAEKPARRSVRGTFDPGYLNYTLGKLQILKLRDDYQAQQGAEFSLQKIHNESPSRTCTDSLAPEIMLRDKSKWDQVLKTADQLSNLQRRRRRISSRASGSSIC